MREIKFRAWDKFNEVMTTTFNVSSQGVLTFTPLGQSPIYLEDMELMQYTGLKDKNGKEIYEGDIINDSMVVGWHKDLASFVLRKNGFMYDHFFGEAIDIKDVEIIGNIHQNPELLTT